jgi:hypothetical protein
MNEEDDKQTAEAPAQELPVLWRFFGKWLLISLGVLIVLVVIENVLVQFKDQSPTPAGKQYFETYGEFITYQESLGYVFLGRFRDAWPAEITEERTSKNEISFELSGGTKHSYPNFDGYELKLVRLTTSQGAEAVVVLRSAEKK